MQDQIVYWRSIVEGGREKLSLDKLSYSRDQLEPALSAKTLDYHYGHLAKGYVERFNQGEGDPDFNRAGAFLHNILFAQFHSPKTKNQPTGKIQDFIQKHFKSYDKFQQEFQKTAMGIQGSGWVYLSKNGDIKTIVNHQIKKDILLLIDWWEHAWALDYQHDKKKYLENQWKIIDWSVIEKRL